MDDFFRFWLGIVFGGLLLIRLYFHMVSGTFRERTYTRTEGRYLAFFRIVPIVISTMACLLYVFWPAAISGASLELPYGVRWLGAVLSSISAATFVWVHHSLGRHFSATLRIRNHHALVTRGPYHWVRHPMYTAGLLLFLGLGLMSANGWVGLPGLIGMVIIMVSRTPREEQMMMKKFGTEYEKYMGRTGRYLPRL